MNGYLGLLQASDIEAPPARAASRKCVRHVMSDAYISLGRRDFYENPVSLGSFPDNETVGSL